MSAAVAGETHELTVDGEAAGERLDRFLARRLQGPTRAALTRLIREGRVTVDGRTASKPGLALRAGMALRVEVPAPPALTPQPEQIALRVVHEDDALLVVDKPAGLTVHPGHGRRTGTLVHGLLGLGVRLASIGAPERPGIVHRLDHDTSGLLVVAKTDAAHRALACAFAAREVSKRYRALVWGRPRQDSGTIEREIGRSRSDPTRMTVKASRGRRRAATTHYRTLEALPGFALLDVDLATGRTHQIRVHLESIGHPIVGDERYGGRAWRGLQDPLRRKAVREFDRLALHAAELSFAHPSSGATVRFFSPLPEQLERLLAVLRGGGR